MTLTYLILFPENKVPEKQVVEVVFEDGSDLGRRRRRGALNIVDYYVSSSIFGIFIVKLDYTVRSGGVDMDSLLREHITTLKIYDSKFKAFLWRHSGQIGVWAASTFFVLNLLGEYLTLVSFTRAQTIYASPYLVSLTNGHISTGLKYFLEVFLSGRWTKFTLALIIFFGIIVAASVSLGIFISEKANNRPSSFLLLKKQAKEWRERSIAARRSGWKSLFVAGVVSLILNIVSSYLFAWLTT